jgi:hypothetical protein
MNRLDQKRNAAFPQSVEHGIQANTASRGIVTIPGTRTD